MIYRIMNISIIIPIHNESANIHVLLEKITGLKLPPQYKKEILIIDDGSKDDSLHKILPFINNGVRVIQLTRNFGQTAALMAGFDQATGDIIVTLDGDLQNDPQDIPLLLQEIENGADVVSGWRKDRKDPVLRTVLSNIANKLISRLTGVYLHDYGCSLKAYKRECLSGFTLYGEMHRFVPVYAALEGANIKEIPVKHHARKHGSSNYGYERIFKVIFDAMTLILLTKFSTKPAYFFGSTGMWLLFCAFMAYGETLWERAVKGTFVHNNPFFLDRHTF